MHSILHMCLGTDMALLHLEPHLSSLCFCKFSRGS
jgi:hypothetical protein